MKSKKQSNKTEYYRKQAGGQHDIKRFVSRRKLYGKGFLKNIAKRYAIPLVKFLGKQAITEIKPGIKLAKKNLKRKVTSTLHDLVNKIDQKGSGKSNKKRKSSKKINKNRANLKGKGCKTQKSLKGKGRKKKSKKSNFQRDIFKSF